MNLNIEGEYDLKMLLMEGLANGRKLYGLIHKIL